VKKKNKKRKKKNGKIHLVGSKVLLREHHDPL